MSPGRRPIHGTRSTSTSTTPARAIRRPKAMRILPRSCTSLEQALLTRGGGRRLFAQVAIGFAGDAASVRRPDDEADLQQVGLDRRFLTAIVDHYGGGPVEAAG